MNGVLLELGFLRRLREDARWERVGFVYGTSAGALSGTMGALDRLDELEAFLMALQPHETFRPHRLWRLPLLGLHDYALPETIAERLEPVESLATDLAAARHRARRVRDGRLGAGGRRRERPRLRADVVVADRFTGGDGPRGARIGRDQRARPAPPCRRPGGHGRRLGPELPARARLRRAARARDRRLSVRADLRAPRRRADRAAPPPAAPVPRRAAGEGPRRRTGGGVGADPARRARPPRGHDGAADAGGDLAQHDRGGALGGRARRLRPRARAAAGGRARARPRARRRRGGRAGRRTLRRGAVPVPARPRAAADHRARLGGRGEPRTGISHAASLDDGGEALTDRARLPADGLGSPLRQSCPSLQP